MRRVLLICVLLAGCASNWPDPTGAPPLRDSGPWPRLVPTAELFETLPAARRGEAGNLAARAAALRARAAILRRDVRSQDDMEALRARLGR